MALTKLNFTGQPTLPSANMPTGSIIKTQKTDYTSTSGFSSAGDLTMSSPLDGTLSFTSVGANTTIFVEAHFSPIASVSTYVSHLIRLHYSTNGSGGSYTRFATGSQSAYNNQANFGATNVSVKGFISNSSANTTYNFKCIVDGFHNGHNFRPNQYIDDGSTYETSQPSSFILIQEIAG
jgi:hypothetical protein